MKNEDRVTFTGEYPLAIENEKPAGGKLWPHATRRQSDHVPAKIHTRQVPAMTPDMREWITGVLDEEYHRGRMEGRREMTEGRTAAEWVMFAIGGAVFFAAQYVWRWITH